MPYSYLKNIIDENWCLGNSLSTINANFTALDVNLSALSAYTVNSVNFLSSTMISVSSNLYTIINSISGTLQTEINYLSSTTVSVSSNLYTMLNSASGTLQTEINYLSSTTVSVSSNLQTEINYLSSTIDTRAIFRLVYPEQTFTTTTLKVVSGLWYDLLPNSRYTFEFNIDYINSTNAEALSLSLSGTPAPTAIRFYTFIYHASDGATIGYGVGNQFGQTVTATTGHATLTGVGRIYGYIQTGANTTTLSAMAATSSGGGNTTTIYASGYSVLTKLLNVN